MTTDDSALDETIIHTPSFAERSGVRSTSASCGPVTVTVPGWDREGALDALATKLARMHATAVSYRESMRAQLADEEDVLNAEARLTPAERRTDARLRRRGL